MPHHYHRKFADNVIFDDVSGDPDDLIRVSYWDIDNGAPEDGQFGAQLTTTVNGAGTAELIVTFKNAPGVSASVPVTAVSGGPANQDSPDGQTPVDAILDLQTSIQPGSRGRNRIPRYSNTPTSEGAMSSPAIYVTVTFPDGQSVGPFYNADFAENVVFDDVSGDPNDLIAVPYWPVEGENPDNLVFAAQLQSTGNGVGTADLLVSFKNAPAVVATVTVDVFE